MIYVTNQHELHREERSPAMLEPSSQKKKNDATD
jgi:hypothetical protein